ncbi:class I SAM-dependent methyltransferase [Planctomicrobium piriforme]|uniref:tRNA (Cmo5U34)-methyltransferase n=1 Tax=Planctomicrobium piriforme TaxID=1576369 RepID=A0A1I3T9K4_9PLAN|nr:class I SAM-dependent methyltransferase [Planctomicrobium piriforme]SFJ66441.1 tRNA (cmo5U34)-methyltransferase [Planctomicrobium piriforme]
MALFLGKSTVDEIRARFDQDVERFSNLETGQSAAIDAPLALELIAQAALAVNPSPTRVLDLGCGAGNFTLRLLQSCDSVTNVTLVDLSQPMLDRAAERLRESHKVQITTLQGDLREVPFDSQQYDVILAGAVLHHLRTDAQWEQIFQRIFEATATGGSFWIFDLITHGHPAIQQLMWARYGQYLTSLKGEAYRDQVYEYATREDSPRPVPYQLQLLAKSGFSDVELLHANACFAAFGGIRPSPPAPVP